jgi:hypothetical protein
VLLAFTGSHSILAPQAAISEAAFDQASVEIPLSAVPRRCGAGSDRSRRHVPAEPLHAQLGPRKPAVWDTFVYETAQCLAPRRASFGHAGLYLGMAQL